MRFPQDSHKKELDILNKLSIEERVLASEISEAEMDED